MKYSLFNPTPYEAHQLIYDKIPASSAVLDVGCATGYFAHELKKKNCKTWGMDIDSEALKLAKKNCEKVFQADLNTVKAFPFKKSSFDAILLMDVIEHLINPNQLLSGIKQYLKPSGKLILSTPNIAFISMRFALLRGKFEYTKMGIMDETHVKFYTKKTLLELLSKNGWKLQTLDMSSGFSQITAIGKYLNYIPKSVQYQITKNFDTLLAYQFIGEFTK